MNNADKTDERISMFENEWKKFSKKLAKDKEKNKGYILSKETQDDLTEPLQSILERYSIADTLSLYFQRRISEALIGMFFLVFLAVVFFEIYAHLWPDKLMILGIYPVLLFLSYFLYMVAKRKDWENRYLDYRALAEGLRVQLFWYLSGIEESVADQYMHIQKTEMDWVRTAIEKYSIVTKVQSGNIKPFRTLSTRKSFEIVLKNWVEDQYNFFTKRIPYNQQRQKFLGLLVNVFFFFGPAVALLLIGLQLYFHLSYDTIHILIVFTLIALLAAASLAGYVEKRAFSVLARRYWLMRNLFDDARKKLEDLLKKHEYEKAQDIIKELGKEALLENGNWLLLKRERPLVIPP
jgi:hypothetical protein